MSARITNCHKETYGVVPMNSAKKGLKIGHDSLPYERDRWGHQAERSKWPSSTKLPRIKIKSWAKRSGDPEGQPQKRSQGSYASCPLSRSWVSEPSSLGYPLCLPVCPAKRFFSEPRVRPKKPKFRGSGMLSIHISSQASSKAEFWMKTGFPWFSLRSGVSAKALRVGSGVQGPASQVPSCRHAGSSPSKTSSFQQLAG